MSSVTVICGRLNQSFLHNQTSKAVTDEDNRSSLSVYVSSGVFNKCRIEDIQSLPVASVGTDKLLIGIIAYRSLLAY
jgi:hypothetical protein